MQVERKQKSGNGGGVGSRLSGGGWERRLGLEGKSRGNVRWGRGCLTFLSTFEEVVEEEIGEVGGMR